MAYQRALGGSTAVRGHVRAACAGFCFPQFAAIVCGRRADGGVFQGVTEDVDRTPSCSRRLPVACLWFFWRPTLSCPSRSACRVACPKISPAFGSSVPPPPSAYHVALHHERSLSALLEDLRQARAIADLRGRQLKAAHSMWEAGEASRQRAEAEVSACRA